MLYAWIDKNGTLCTTYDLTYVPEEYKANVVVFEDLEISEHDKLIVDNGVIRKKTDAELLNELKQSKLQELKQYVSSLLSQTDWVVIKLQSM